MGGNLVRGHSSRLIKGAIIGKPKHLKKDHVYFYSKSKSWNDQLAVIQRVRPAAVVIPKSLISSSIPRETGIIVVSNVYQAIWRLALWNRRQLPTPVVGITGSAGKSTTTEMVSSILKQKFSLMKTLGNLNTYNLLPIHLLRLSPGHRLLVLEMGMNSLNNIGRQCQVVPPDVGAVTNVGEAHAGSLGGLNVVIKAKQELVDGMKPGGTLFLNADCERSRRLSTKRFKGKLHTFGIKNPASIRGENIRFGQRGMLFDVRLDRKRYTFTIPTFGTHNVYNALAAIGMARAMGCTTEQIQTGLARFSPPKMRLQLIQGPGKSLFINDAWNANPTAAKAGLSVLSHFAKKRPITAVLGDMLELGSYTRPAHRLVGRYAAKLPLYKLITYGKFARTIAETAIANGMTRSCVHHFTNRTALLRYLDRLPSHSVIYFKASRKSRFEKLIEELKHRLPST
ncbi:UDP-N-acetylmuramoyl-tripeptide--D-alanyl-D-alanine ligase [Marinithermofilum abyssi]|uniref:UDP-N-acetylmuramoyl-tripeptide--D-alanyl-D-alanine ligase n=1 Tax=Marinithermofilum abyssi TaxID=1571185 RepID=A0A8J2Y900_9BACL|nr:UDP-N-acetylmuramoyl-tripeptide--D-alanyl-D-alanine ligase [Marinithermofilum abyssi]GGE12257.1 UDP-N-acetylmuramoyl-tripeptide--D-alanyl-D-alanine ligase [Marinithermofilum abyssi]